MELLTQIWKTVGTPLTIMFWVYTVLTIASAICAGVVIFTVFCMSWKDRKKFGGWG